MACGKIFVNLLREIEPYVRKELLLAVDSMQEQDIAV